MKTMIVSSIKNFVLWFLLCNPSLSLLLVQAQQQQQQQQQQQVPFETIMQGTYSAIKSELEGVYRTNDEYTKLHLQHHADMNGGMMAMPIIDFQYGKLLVAAIYLGTKNSGGYAVNITNVILEEDGSEGEGGEKDDQVLLIEYVAFEKGPNDMVTLALTQPYHVIQIGPLPDNIDQENVKVRFKNVNEVAPVEVVMQKQEPEEEVQIQFETLIQGGSSSIEKELQAVYRTYDQFSNFFSQHNADVTGDLIPMPISNTTNFQNEKVLVAAINLGTKNTGGYGVAITNVILKEEGSGGEGKGEDDDPVLVIEYVTVEPGPNDMVTMALTQPHHVIQIGPLPDNIDQENVRVRFENVKKIAPVEVVPELLRFLITFTETTDPKTVVKTIQDNLSEYITNAELLAAVRVGIIDFDASNDAINAESAMKLLTKIDGVNTVELDSVVSIDNNNNDNNNINSVGVALVADTTMSLSISTPTKATEEEEINGEGVLIPLRFILTVDNNTEMSSVKEMISNSTFFNDILSDIQLLSSLPMMFVDFDETKMNDYQKTKSDVRSQLQNIDGVNSVEEDGIISIDEDMSGEEDNIGIVSINETQLGLGEEEENIGIPADDNNNKKNDKDEESSSSSISQMLLSSFFAVVAVVFVDVL